MKKYSELIIINPTSIIPKYRQLAEAIVKGISSGQLHRDEILPSIHDFSVRLEISKNSVEKAYNILKKQGVVGSVKGKGFYILELTNND